MTFGEMKAEVFRLLRESSSSPVMWAEADVEQALNEGYMELSDETEWYERYQTVEILDKQPYYDARTLFRHPFLRISAAYNFQTSRWLIPASPQEFDRSDRRWQERNAEPEFFFTRGLWWLCYWPVKPVNSGTIKQYYKALPPALAEEDDVPGFHSSLHYALVEYALADLYSQDGEPSMTWEHFKRYMEYEAKMSDQTGNRNKIPLAHGNAEEK